MVDLDRAVAMLPHLRWIRYLRFQLLLDARRAEEAERDVQAMEILAPLDLELRYYVASEFERSGNFARASKEFERVDADGGNPAVWADLRRSRASLLQQATHCAARAGDAPETVRLLRKLAEVTKWPPMRADIRKDKDYVPLLETPEFRRYLDELED
jgi:predicted Zn-dependent protease